MNVNIIYYTSKILICLIFCSIPLKTINFPNIIRPHFFRAIKIKMYWRYRWLKLKPRDIKLKYLINKMHFYCWQNQLVWYRLKCRIKSLTERIFLKDFLFSLTACFIDLFKKNLTIYYSIDMIFSNKKIA